MDIGGLDVLYWVELYLGCHSTGGVQFGWPDGKSYLEQDNILVEVFKMIKNQIQEMPRK